jgi:RimJ/RimL family protein N-acetyltransferase
MSSAGVGAAYTIDAVSLRAQPVDAVGMLAHARSLQTQAMQHFDPAQGARCASEAALLFVLLGHPDDARALFDFALARQPASERLYDRTVTELRFAQLPQFAGQLAESESLFAELVARCRDEPRLHPLLDFALQHLGKVLFDRGDYVCALDCFREALALREAKDDRQLTASTQLAITAATARLAATISVRSLVHSDMPMLRDWLCRPHVSRWWGEPVSRAAVERDYLPLTDEASAMRGYIASLDERPIGFVQSYLVRGCGDGWWEQQETDPGARGIDQFIAHSEDLGRGLGSAMIRAFVERLFLDATVSKLQADPAPDNERAIRSCARAGFVMQGEVMTPDGVALLMVRRR